MRDSSYRHSRLTQIFPATSWLYATAVAEPPYYATWPVDFWALQDSWRSSHPATHIEDDDARDVHEGLLVGVSVEGADGPTVLDDLVNFIGYVRAENLDAFRAEFEECGRIYAEGEIARRG